jgi:monothiol glutaredoxin
MPLSEAMRARLAGLVNSKDVVLFMKGSRHFPQCGFSATVVGILDKVGVTGYETVNVLSDPEVREGIKEFSSWPTIPQLYVKGEFVGGCDIVKEMFASGELQRLLGKDGASSEAKAPSITVLDGAAKAFGDAAREAGDDVLRFEIDPEFKNDLYFGAKAPGDVVVTSNGIAIHLDAATARRAEGVTIDFVSGPKGAGFKIENPNEPPRVRALSAAEAKAMLDAGALQLFDVRPEGERALAKIAAAKPLDEAGQRYLLSLPKDAPIALHCHHGIRSRRAGEQLLQEGFTRVYNVEGGIEAWSQSVDPSVPRY